MCVFFCRLRVLSIRVRPSWCYISQGPQTFSTHLGDMLLLCKTSSDTVISVFMLFTNLLIYLAPHLPVEPSDRW
jgi:hypothetical protein